MNRLPVYPAKSILITVKTYPTLSARYDELVCTAGIDENGNWFRIYPIPFRRLDYEKQYTKYSWMTLALERNDKDFRPESYRPTHIEGARITGEIKADGGAWVERRKHVLKKVYSSLNILLAEAKNPQIRTSLATFKPEKIVGFTIEKSDRDWDAGKVAEIEKRRKQLTLFDEENPLRVVRKIPYKFSYRILDVNGKKAKMMIEDWEIGQLYWNSLARRGSEEEACADVRKKYFDDFANTKDLHLFHGTTLEYHNIGINPFIIIGTFHPKPQIQTELF
ncbi:MAG: hypothetical protein HN368_13715 [Spirochaetales bacterium]|jgi:hypothetical protein|nr:hypothetical protein [Spirochaetales bacterium]